jgi:hypothetical protein
VFGINGKLPTNESPKGPGMWKRAIVQEGPWSVVIGPWSVVSGEEHGNSWRACAKRCMGVNAQVFGRFSGAEGKRKLLGRMRLLFGAHREGAEFLALAYFLALWLFDTRSTSWTSGQGCGGVISLFSLSRFFPHDAARAITYTLGKYSVSGGAGGSL